VTRALIAIKREGESESSADKLQLKCPGAWISCRFFVADLCLIYWRFMRDLYRSFRQSLVGRSLEHLPTIWSHRVR
jgi:hypothetical protein